MCERNVEFVSVKLGGIQSIQRALRVCFICL